MQRIDAVARQDATAQDGDRYGWYVLGVLMLVYLLNFLDRQLLTILAPNLKRDLAISDSDFGFLYGTAFGVFYALFGIPLGKLADRWVRVKLLALGLTLWSAMTAFSGLSRNFAQIALARVGVGIGEATASPCAYSLIGDYFPPHRRATALGIYSSGLYLGAGVSLFLGSRLANGWDEAFANGGAPGGLAGWQATFLIIGIPGLLLAAWVASLREPLRGRFEQGVIAPQVAPSAFQWDELLQDLMDVVPPFTLIGVARRGPKAIAANLFVAALMALAAALLIRLVGDPAQWIAFAIGCYAIFSWMVSLRHRDPHIFAAMFQSWGFVGVTLGYSVIGLIGYAFTAFSPLYAIEHFGADAAETGFLIGGASAVGGILGVVGGGALADRFSTSIGNGARVLVIAGGAAGALLFYAAMFTTESLPLYFLFVFCAWIFFSMTLGGSSGAVVNIVPADVRGVAAAAFQLGTNMIGLALGPYTAGKISTEMGSLGGGMLALLVVSPIAFVALGMAWRDLRQRHVLPQEITAS